MTKAAQTYTGVVKHLMIPSLELSSTTMVELDSSKPIHTHTAIQPKRYHAAAT